jgi:hypothetical protein
MQKAAKTMSDSLLKWKPSPEAMAHSALARFRSGSYGDIWRWSVDRKEDFWSQVWDFCGIVGDKGKTVFKSAPVFQDARFSPKRKSTSPRIYCAAVMMASRLFFAVKTKSSAN